MIKQDINFAGSEIAESNIIITCYTILFNILNIQLYSNVTLSNDVTLDTVILLFHYLIVIRSIYCRLKAAYYHCDNKQRKILLLALKCLKCLSFISKCGSFDSKILFGDYHSNTHMNNQYISTCVPGVRQNSR